MEAPKVSFTIRRPTPVSRATSTGADSDGSTFKVPALPPHLAASESSAPGSPLRIEDADRHVDSSDEEGAEQDELVTGFDQFGVQRLHEKKKPTGPLVIPALQNRDWREMAKARRAGPNGARYVPDSARAGTGVDGSVGGLGTRDVINAGPQKEGLQVRVPRAGEADAPMKTEEDVDADGAVKKEELTEDQLAIRALLSGADPNATRELDAIPMGRATEDDAYLQDVEALPDQATLEDYERVPVEAFGAALLRGMGWAEGGAASRRRTGPVEPWVPVARPALLGIGAKEKEVFDDGSKKRANKRPERRYVPVVKKGGEEESEDGKRGDERKDRAYDRDRDDRDRDRRDKRDKGRDRDDRDKRDKRDSDRDYSRDDRRDRDRRREYSDRDRERSPRRDERSRRDRDRGYR